MYKGWLLAMEFSFKVYHVIHGTLYSFNNLEIYDSVVKWRYKTKFSSFVGDILDFILIVTHFDFKNTRSDHL